MPGMEFKRRGLKARALVRDMERIPLERVKREMVLTMSSSMLQSLSYDHRYRKQEPLNEA